MQVQRNQDTVEDQDTVLEPLPGAVVPQFIRCGKPGCQCSYGHRHGPYFYRVWRDEDSQVRKVYVKITEVETVRQQTRFYEEMQQELRRLVQLRHIASTRLARRRYLLKKEQQAEERQAKKNAGHAGQNWAKRQATQARLAEEIVRSRALSSSAAFQVEGAKATVEEAQRVIAASRQLREDIAQRRRQRTEAS